MLQDLLFEAKKRATGQGPLLLSWLCTMLTPAIAPPPSFGAIGRYVVLMGASLSALLWSGFGRRHCKVQLLTLVTLLLGGSIILHSTMISPIPDVSLLKAVSWTISVTTLLSAWGGMGDTERQQTTAFIFMVLVVLAVTSLPLLAFNSIGRLRNATGFQGWLNHPQAFGPAMGILAGWAVSLFLAQSRPDLKLALIAGISMVFVILSEARTGAAAFVFGLFFGAGAISLLTGLNPLRIFPSLRSVRLWVCVFVLVLALIPSMEAVLTSLEYFISKSGRAGVNMSLREAYNVSRGPLIEIMLSNIESNPLFGIGFGISSDPTTMVIERDPFLGLPTSATVEKGVVPVMVVEELGIPLGITVVGWLFLIVRRAARGGFEPLVILLTMLALNMGEAILFSPGGQGLLILILLTWAATAPPIIGR